MFDAIKKAIESNNSQEEEISGIYVHYSRLKNSISLVINFTGIIFFVSAVFYFHESSVFVIMAAFSCFYFGYDSTLVLSRILLKKPVLILSKGKLFFYETQEWYSVENYQFAEEYIGRYDIFGSYVMYDRKGRRVFLIKNWHIENPDKLQDHIRYSQLLLKQVD